MRRNIPVNRKYLYNIYTMLDQRRRRWADIVYKLCKCLLWSYTADTAFDHLWWMVSGDFGLSFACIFNIPGTVKTEAEALSRSPLTMYMDTFNRSVLATISLLCCVTCNFIHKNK